MAEKFNFDAFRNVLEGVQKSRTEEMQNCCTELMEEMERCSTNLLEEMNVCLSNLMIEIDQFGRSANGNHLGGCSVFLRTKGDFKSMSLTGGV